MHELCSYILFVMEMDLFDLETSPQPEFDYLLDEDFTLNDAFVLFESIMVLLGRCYEESDSMSNSIVAKIPYVARDKDLYNHIQAIPMSHEVYCARWVRLMFGREVKGWRNVLSLWDIFFDLTTEDASILSMDVSRYTRPGLENPLKLGTWELDQVLEMTGAAMIWLKRKELLSRQAEDAMELLVNYEPLESAAPLLGTLLSSLHRVQTNEHMAPLLLPSHEGEASCSNFIKINMSSMPILRRLSTKPMDHHSGRRSSGTSARGGRRRSLNPLKVHRRSSIQNFADNSTRVCDLLTDDDDDESEDDEYDEDEEADQFDFNSCDGTASCALSDDGCKSVFFDDERTVKTTTDTTRRVSILTLMRGGHKKIGEEAEPPVVATELNVIGRSICTTTTTTPTPTTDDNDDNLAFVLEDFSEELRDIADEREGEQSGGASDDEDDPLDSSMRVDSNVAFHIGISMAY